MSTTTETTVNDRIAGMFRHAIQAAIRDHNHHHDKLTGKIADATITEAIETFAEQAIESDVKYKEWSKIGEILDKEEDTLVAVARIIDHVRTRQVHLLRHQPWARMSSRPFTNVIRQVESAALARVLEQIADMAVWAKGKLENKPTQESR